MEGEEGEEGVMRALPSSPALPRDLLGGSKPQLRFADVIDNSTAPFRCKHPAAGLDGAHPYAAEVGRLTLTSAPQWQRMARGPPPSLGPIAPLLATPWRWIDTPEELQELVDELNRTDEFAFDTEQHSYRSYQGFICVVQISTKEHDYLIDAISLRHCMIMLDQPFANAAIMKVAHGCKDDLARLQRDFGLFAVNVFDTEIAAKAIGCRQVSLTHLYSQYCEIPPGADLARADWRIRPLTPEMVEYCRTDTRYLLALRDRLVMGIHMFDVDKKMEIFSTIMEKGKEACLLFYQKKVLPSSCRQDINFRAGLQSLKSEGIVPTHAQMMRIENLYRLRDSIARQEDEGVQYVLPKMILLKIALSEPPSSVDELLSYCTEAPLVEKYATDIIATLRQDHCPVEVHHSVSATSFNPTSSGGVINVEILSPDHAKSILHHVAQALSKGKRMPRFETVSEGLSHKPHFTTSVSLEISAELIIVGEGHGSTKRDAERRASFEACEALIKNGLLSATKIERPLESSAGSRKHSLDESEPQKEKRSSKRHQPEQPNPSTLSAIPILSAESPEPQECHLYTLHLPNIDKERVYPHMAGYQYVGFTIISSTALHIPHFKIAGKGYVPIEVQVVASHHLKLHAEQLNTVANFQEYLFRSLLRIEKQLRYPKGCLFILPRFTEIRSQAPCEDMLNLALISSLMQPTRALDLLHTLLEKAHVSLDELQSKDLIAEDNDLASIRRNEARKLIGENFDGRMFFTRYNGQAYVLCSVSFDVTPQCWFRMYNHQWLSFVEYYRQKKIDLADHNQPMIMANQSNMGVQAIVIPGKSDAEEREKNDAPPDVPLALGNCLYMPIELCDLSGVTFEMSTKFIHYLPTMLNHIHRLQLFYNKLTTLQQAAQIDIRKLSLLKEALTHTSFANLHETCPEHNERLEFLGDAVLEFVVATRVYLLFPELSEGELTNKKRDYIRNVNLAKAANRIRLSDHLLYEGKLSKAELSILAADAFEAIIGALFIDKGIDSVNNFCERWLFDVVEGQASGRLVRSPLFTKPTDALAVALCPPIVHPDAQANARIEEAEAILGFSFENKSHLLQALTHRSFGCISGETSDEENSAEWSYERLEFLGDSLLKFITTVHLYHASSVEVREGMLSDQRSMLVRNQTLAGCTSKLGLQSLILHKRPTVSPKDKMLGDVIESLIGAAYMDKGMADSETMLKEHGCACGVDVYGCLVHKLVISQCSAEFYLSPDKAEVDAKGLLQSLCLKQGFSLPRYQLLREITQADGSVQSEVGVYVRTNDEQSDSLQATGIGSSLSEAHKAAARAALDRMFPSRSSFESASD